jgi:hypothetical protein
LQPTYREYAGIYQTRIELLPQTEVAMEDVLGTPRWQGNLGRTRFPLAKNIFFFFFL